MAYYNFTFSCGHEDSIQLFGKEKERQRKIEYFKEFGICKKCYREKIEQYRAEALSKAIENAKIKSLPELKGSEKQITWALTIRDVFLEDIEKYSNEWEQAVVKLGASEEQIKIGKEEFDIVKNFFINKTHSAFWIDNRDNEVPIMILKYTNEIINTPEGKNLHMNGEYKIISKQALLEYSSGWTTLKKFWGIKSSGFVACVHL